MQFLNSLNHYRALSIVLIVAIHVPSTADLALETYTSQFLFNLVRGATFNFVFISGFLFYIVFYKRFKYSKFIKSRVDRYLKPYLFLSILPILISLVTIPLYWDNSNIIEFNNNNLGVWNLVSALKYLVTGAHITAYWYIPFIMLMVFVTPLFAAFVKLKLKKQLIIFGVFLILSSFVQRPFERLDLFQALHSVVYFTPIYLMGIICAIHRNKIYELLKGKEIYLLSAVLFIVTWQTSKGHVGLYKTDFLTYNGIDVLLFKMVLVCLFFMIWLHRFEHVKKPIVSEIAKASFTIYFLHVYFLKVINSIKSYFNLTFENYSVLAFTVIVFILIVMSLLTARAVHWLLPNYSYVLIGYGEKSTKTSKLVKLKNAILSKNKA